MLTSGLRRAGGDARRPRRCGPGSGCCARRSRPGPDRHPPRAPRYLRAAGAGWGRAPGWCCCWRRPRPRRRTDSPGGSWPPAGCPAGPAPRSRRRRCRGSRWSRGNRSAPAGARSAWCRSARPGCRAAAPALRPVVRPAPRA
ncbi:hypothetical protein G6F61_014404 [Rhizopus arrhizus]|nr:hypothetical protein G6F61_014404 [Rhizopus arrhizus]